MLPAPTAMSFPLLAGRTLRLALTVFEARPVGIVVPPTGQDSRAFSAVTKFWRCGPTDASEQERDGERRQGEDGWSVSSEFFEYGFHNSCLRVLAEFRLSQAYLKILSGI